MTLNTQPDRIFRCGYGTVLTFGTPVVYGQVVCVYLFDDGARRIFEGQTPAPYAVRFDIVQQWDRGRPYLAYQTSAKRPLTSEERLYFNHLLQEAQVGEREFESSQQPA